MKPPAHFFLAALSRIAAVCIVWIAVIGALNSPSAWGTTNSWLAAVSGDWSDVSKWSRNSSPVSTDDASIPFTGITVTFNTSATVNSLDTSAALLLNGGSLSGTQANAATAVTVSNGLLTLNGAGLSNLTLKAGAGTITVAANGGNSFNGIVVNHDISLDTNGYVQVFNSNTVNSTISLAGGGNGIQLRDGNATLGLSATGVIQGSAAVFETFGGATVADNGLINANQMGNTLSLNVDFITGAGTLQATNGGILSIGGRLNGSGLNVSVDNTAGIAVIINGGGLSGTLASTTGTGLSFAANGSNVIDSATINGDLTFAGAAYAQVFNANTVSGTIHMAGTSNGIQLRDGNATLTVNSGGAIRGYGAIFQTFGGATLANNGIVSADTAGQTLTLNPSNIGGSGTFEAKNGGVLSIGGLWNGNNAVVNVDANPNSAVLVNGGGLTGSFAASTGTGISFANNGSNTISSATIGADLTFAGAAYAQVFNANTVSGTIHMAGTSNGIQLRDGNATLTVNSGGAIRGYGAIFQTFGGATLANNGIVSADTAGQTLTLNPSNIGGSGTFEAKNGGVLSIGGLWNGNNAVVNVDANPNSAVLVNGGGLTGSFAASTGTGISFANNGSNTISSATIGADLTFAGAAYTQVFNANTVSGTIHMAGTSNGIQLRDGNATLTIGPTGEMQGYGAVFETFGGSHFANNGTIAANVAGKTLTFNNSFIANSSTITVQALSTLQVGGSLSQSAGHTTIDGALNLAQLFAVNGGLLSGSGTISGSVSNAAGQVAPGDSPGLLTITGNYGQLSSGQLDIELGGATPGAGYDQLVVGNAATLAGAIDVDLVNGFVPFVGEQFDVLTRASGSGTFSATLSDDPGLTYTVDYHPDRVTITITSVAEPSSLILASVCVFTLLAIRPILERRRTGDPA